MEIREGRKFRIKPKRDFGSGKGFLINGKWVKKGFVVTDGFCNIMPGATWFKTVESAMEAISIFSIAKDSNEFWEILYAKNRERKNGIS